MWLASVSKRGRGGVLLPTAKWRRDYEHVHRRVMGEALRGVGDPSRERLFRMNVTLCLHRVVTDAEAAHLRVVTFGERDGLAGGPVELLWSRGIAVSDSCRPCANPGRMLPDPRRPDLWIPLDCQQCGPCLARAACARAS